MQDVISRAIEAKPEELRVFLEEAAGISKYKERRRETENRLADTRENLARITDIRLDLGAQIEKLDAQAQVATRYQELHADLQLKQHLLWYLRRRDAGAERERHSAEVARVTNELEAENAQSRSLEARLEAARAAHYQAGDAMNSAQAALYGANAEVARHESELKHAEETRARLESQHTERGTQLTAWREQRSQLTQALHMWAARAGGAKQRVTETKHGLDQETARLPQAEQAFRAAQERLTEGRSQLMQAESRLQLEQANGTQLQSAAEPLAQRRERFDSELQALAEPDAAALRELEGRIGQVDASLEAARQAFEALQAECAALQESSAQAAEAVGVAQREHAAAEAQLSTLRQIQAEVQNNAPLREWLERHGLGSAAQLWQKLRIHAGWETAVDAGLLARQAEIEALGERCAGLARRLEASQRALEQAESERLERETALEESRLEIGRQEKARHDAQIEQLKLAQAQERFRERSAQLRAEQAELAEQAEQGRPALAACEAAPASIAGEIAAARQAPQ